MKLSAKLTQLKDQFFETENCFSCGIKVRLYLVPNVPSETEFKAKTRGEIKVAES